MSDDRLPPDALRNADGVDPGLPIEALSGLREEPSPVFRARVMDTINRRVFTIQAMDVPYWGFSQLILEYIQVILGALGIKDSEDRKEN